MADKTYEEELQHLKQCVPKLIECSGNPNKSYRELVIQFVGANLQNFANLAKALEIYCFPTNTKKTGAVTDPYVDGGPEAGKVSGLWRFASVNPSLGRNQGVFLTLREGYASSLQWDEARVPSRDLLPQTDNTPVTGETNQDEDYIDVIFPNVDPEKSAAMCDAFRALETRTDPTVWTHEYSGTYEVIRGRMREEDDGSHTIVGLLAKPRSFVKTYENYNSHNAADVYYLHHVPKRIVQSIVDLPAYKTDGATATLNYSTERGTYDVIIRTGVDEPITIINKQTEDGCQTEVYTDFYWGITKTAMEAVQVGSAPQGWVYTIPTISPAANGRFNVRRERIKGIAKTATAYTSQITSTNEVVTQEKKNQTSVESLGAAEQGIIKRIRAAINRFCLFDSAKDTITSTPWSNTFTLEALDGDETHYVAGNQRENTWDAPAEGNYHFLKNWGRNEDGTYNWYIIERTDDYATEVTHYWYYRTSKEREVILANPTDVTKPYQSQNRVYRWKFETQKFKTEAAAYLWLRESDFLRSNSGVSGSGGRWTGQRTFLDIDFGWQNIGNPYGAA